ncbi:MAG: GWxTD domain-containing protein, partial [bacterium]
AGYELTLTVLDSKKNVIETRIREKYITVKNFESTNSRDEYSFLQELFYLIPGEYRLVIELMDNDSKLTVVKYKNVDIIDYFSVPFSISDVLLLNKINQQGKISYTPNLITNYNTNQKDIYLQFDVFNNKKISVINIQTSIKDYNDNLYKAYNYIKNLEGFRTSVLLQVVKEELASGNYILDLEVKGDEEIIKRKLQFSVNWMNMTELSRDINSAIKQLKYIAPLNEIDQMLKTEDSNKREELFNEFWASRDPTPSTEVNELKKEYYSRVAFANKHFSDTREGWLTDRGEVYIVLGPPDDIRQYPHMIDSKPYEVWYYYRFGENLIFVDETGLGNFRLTQESWETYIMLKNRY